MYVHTSHTCTNVMYYYMYVHYKYVCHVLITTKLLYKTTIALNNLGYLILKGSPRYTLTVEKTTFTRLGAENFKLTN